MRYLGSAFLFLLASLTDTAAQGALPEWNFKPFVERANIATRYLTQTRYTNADVAAVARLGCDTLRFAREDGFFGKSRTLINGALSRREEIQKIATREFIAFEADSLRRSGASAETIALVSRTIEAEPNLMIRHAEDPRYLGERLESTICQIDRDISLQISQKVAEATATASSTNASVAASIGWIVVGSAVMVVNGYFAVQSAGIATAILAFASGGWGWNRIEESGREVHRYWRPRAS